MKAFGQEGTGWVRITPGEGDIPADAVDLNTGAPSEVATFADGIGLGGRTELLLERNWIAL